MAHEPYTRTNQKLFFAGLCLENWRKAEEGRAMNAQAQVQAEREAALFHLHGALLGLCHEITHYYRMPNPGAPDVAAILSSEVLSASPSPELAELVELFQQPESWLGSLERAYQALFLPPQAPTKVKVDPTLPLIEAVVLDEEEAPLSREELESWRQRLKALVLRYRESLSEC